MLAVGIGLALGGARAGGAAGKGLPVAGRELRVASLRSVGSFFAASGARSDAVKIGSLGATRATDTDAIAGVGVWGEGMLASTFAGGAMIFSTGAMLSAAASGRLELLDDNVMSAPATIASGAAKAKITCFDRVAGTAAGVSTGVC